MRHERWPRQAREADELPVVQALDRPQPEAVLDPVLCDRVDEGIARGTIASAAEELNHVGVRVQGREGRAVGSSPIAQE
jgi:hypothetical protein